MLHGDSRFITLTYNDKHLPDKGSLVKRDYQLFLKRVRKRYRPIKVRYFITGEYGNDKKRPHYHVLLFGLPLQLCPGCKHEVRRKRTPEICDCETQALWTTKEGTKIGSVYVGDVNRTSISYTAKYVIKKLTQKDHPDLEGRLPEFARMSLKPGIGVGAIPDLAKFFTTDCGADILISNGDVPHTFKTDGRDWPLGKHLLGKFREEVGWSKKLPDSQYAKWIADHAVESRKPEYETRRKRDYRKSKWLESITRVKGSKL